MSDSFLIVLESAPVLAIIPLPTPAPETSLVAIGEGPVLLTAGQEAVLVGWQVPGIVIAPAGQGPPGTQGPPGVAGNQRIEHPFAYGDATPALIGSVPAGKLLERVLLLIDVPFDGPGATLKVGDVGNTSRVMATTDNDPSQAAGFELCPNFAYGTDTNLYLTINAGALPTQGAGLVIIEVED